MKKFIKVKFIKVTFHGEVTMPLEACDFEDGDELRVFEDISRDIENTLENKPGLMYDLTDFAIDSGTFSHEKDLMK